MNKIEIIHTESQIKDTGDAMTICVTTMESYAHGVLGACP